MDVSNYGIGNFLTRVDVSLEKREIILLHYIQWYVWLITSIIGIRQWI